MKAESLYIQKLTYDENTGNEIIGFFPSETNPAIVSSYTYDAKRMGGAPTITATIYSSEPLQWKKEEFVEYNGDRFFASYTPNSTKDNSSRMWKSEITFSSRRELLDNTLFFDVVVDDVDTQNKDRYRSNQTKFTFGGTIYEFVARINSSMAYCGLYRPTDEYKGYYVVVDEGYGTDEVKEVSFEDQYLTDVLQLINTTFELDYYWDGNVCHVGKVQHDLTDTPIKYGCSDALISVSKENANYKIVDMITGYGSSDNLPYYYPNDDEFGEAVFNTDNISKNNVSIDLSKLQNTFGAGNEYNKKFVLSRLITSEFSKLFVVKRNVSEKGQAYDDDPTQRGDSGELKISAKFLCIANCKIDLSNLQVNTSFDGDSGISCDFSSLRFEIVKNGIAEIKNSLDNKFVCDQDGIYEFRAYTTYQFYCGTRLPEGVDFYNGIAYLSLDGNVTISYQGDGSDYVCTEDGSIQVKTSECGILFQNTTDSMYATISLVEYISQEEGIDGGVKMSAIENTEHAASVIVTDRIWLYPSSVLLPSIYRKTGGAERFYYALNNTHKLPSGIGYYEFVNLYKKGNPHQGTVTFDDIKPTINGIVNAEGQLFGEIADVAFDKEDSDVKDSDGNYIHSYFYIKLHKFNGDFGFDLFAHALASEPAKINLIKSNGCPACSFVIHNQPSADNSKCYNCVSVDENGNLKPVRTDKNDYIFDNASDAYEDKLNQDSTQKELWIAVQKDTSTLGIIMPNASAGFKPQKGDLFVITGIKPPKVLVTAAEKRLDDALIKHMSENNTDQFNYSVKFSRIFLQENPDFASKLNENAKLSIQIHGDSDSDGNLISHEVFVSNYSVKVDNDELAEVEVELVNSLEVTKSDTKQIIDAVKGETVKSLSSMVGGNNTNSFNASITDKMYLSKLKDDTANGKITFIKGLIAKALADLAMGAKFGNNAKITEFGEAVFSAIKSLDYDNAAEQGFSVEKEKNGKYHAFVTNLTIWGKAIFHELEVRKLSYSGGNIYLSGAGSKIIKVVHVKQSVSNGVATWVETTEDDAECVGWKCYLLADNGTTATMNYWQDGDQVRCQTIGEIVAGGAYSDVSNKSYWRTIPNGGVSTQNEKIYGTKTETYIDEDGNEQTREVQVELYDGQAFAWIVIGKHCGDIDGYDDEFSVGYNGSNPAPLETRDIPSAGDTIVLDGNRHRNEQGEYDKTDRQNVIILETTGEYAPRIACYANISEYKHTITKSVNGNNKEVSLSVFETSPKGGTKINSSRFEWISDDGSTINIINYRGDWVSDNTYHKNDQVNYNNAVWVCVANSGVDVKEKPSDGATYWKKVLSGGKGENGEGVVMAYKNATSRPEPPVTEDLSLLTDGWSRTPQKGGSYEKVSNVSYGNYSVGNTESGYSTSEWSEVSDSGETWRKSPAGLSNNGWALMKVSFTTNMDNADVRVVIKAYSETNFDFIHVHDIDTEITGSSSLRGVAYISGNGIETSYSYHVTTAGQHFFYVSYCKDSSQNANGDYGLFRLDLSENLVSMPSTVWMSQAVLKEGKAVLPWSTPVQLTGDDAYRVEVSPSTLVFDTNENGLVDSDTLSGKYATVTVYKGNQKISTDNLSLPSNYATEKCTNVEGRISNINGEARITIDRIYQETISGDVTVSKSSGQISFPIDVFGERSTLMWVTVNVQVNVSKFTGSVAFDNKVYKAQFDELSKNAATKDELTRATSKFEQTAREISLSVSEKSIGRRNLLVGSAFNRQEGFGLLLDANVRGYGILMNDGVDGMNCIKVASYYDGTRYQYCGAFWGGNHTKNIRIKHGTKYTFSCWVKVLYANTTVYLEVIYNRAEIGNDRDERITGDNSFAIKEPNKWQLVKWSFTTDDTHDWIEANVFTSSNVAYKTFVASFCKPMLSEGDYNGWTLSQDDYEYIGGNLLDNARTLDKSGTLVMINDIVIQNGYGTDSACAKNLMQANATLSDYKEVLKWIFRSTYLVNGNDYIFSFVAKADVDDARVVCYMWSGDIENSCDIFTEGNGGTWDSRSDGNIVFILSRQWKRYWVHWRPKDGYATPKEVIIRHTGNKSTSASTVYVTQPKLEIGATMTEWTERKTDLVDKASLKKAGIEITSEQVTLYGNKVQVKNPKANPSEGYDEAAMFQNGKLNAQFINAGEVVAEGINAKEIKATKLNVTGDSKIGIWHITKVDGWGDVMQAEGTEYNGATVVSGIQYCPLFVRGGSLLTDYFRVGGSCTEFSYTSGNNDFSAVWLGNAARIVCKGSSNAMNLPTNYAYNTQYEPVHYIYSEQSKKDSPALAINVIAKGFTGTPTALQTNGAIRGVIAPNLRIMNYSGQISSSDCIVIVTKGGITLKLPAGPVVGQTLLIYSKVSSNVYIEYDSSGGYGTGKMYSGGSLQTKIEIGRAGTFTYFIFDGENWCYAYFDGSHHSV